MHTCEEECDLKQALYDFGKEFNRRESNRLNRSYTLLSLSFKGWPYLLNIFEPLPFLAFLAKNINEKRMANTGKSNVKSSHHATWAIREASGVLQNHKYKVYYQARRKQRGPPEYASTILSLQRRD